MSCLLAGFEFALGRQGAPTHGKIVLLKAHLKNSIQSRLDAQRWRRANRGEYLGARSGKPWPRNGWCSPVPPRQIRPPGLDRTTNKLITPDNSRANDDNCTPSLSLA
jgi:hypothetical protein